MKVKVERSKIVKALKDIEGIEVVLENANDANSQLSHCVIEFGGQDQNFSANILLQNVSPEISNCLIRQSIGYGVYISGKIQSGKLMNNTIIDNAFAPISAQANGVSGLTAGMYLGLEFFFIIVILVFKNP